MEQITDTKFGINVSNEKLINVAKCHVYSFYRFWVIKKKPAGVANIHYTDPDES